MYYSTIYPSPIGNTTLASDGKNLIGVWIEGQKYHGGTVSEELLYQSNIPVLEATKKWLDKYFTGENPLISELPLAPIGGEFRQQIWSILCEIPYGEVITYGSIARKMATLMGKEHMSAQAIGGAVSHNPISIIIPCHRVVGSSGSLTGYAGGMDIKIKLLSLEGVPIENFFIPKK